MFKNEMADDNEMFLFASLVIFVLRLRRRRNATKTMRSKRFWVREVYSRRQSQGKANTQDLTEGLI